MPLSNQRAARQFLFRFVYGSPETVRECCEGRICPTASISGWAAAVLELAHTALAVAQKSVATIIPHELAIARLEDCCEAYLIESALGKRL